MPADSTHARTLLRMTQDLKARVVADAERLNLSESEWWRRAGEAMLSGAPSVASPPAERTPEVRPVTSRSAASPRARTAPPAAGPTATTPKPSAQAKAGVRPQPKQGKQ